MHAKPGYARSQLMAACRSRTRFRAIDAAIIAVERSTYIVTKAQLLVSQMRRGDGNSTARRSLVCI